MIAEAYCEISNWPSIAEDIDIGMLDADVEIDGTRRINNMRVEVFIKEFCFSFHDAGLFHRLALMLRCGAWGSRHCKWLKDIRYCSTL